MIRIELEKQIRAIIFDDEFAILGKVKWQNDKTVGPQVEQFKVDSLIALIKGRDNEIVKELEKQEQIMRGFTPPKDRDDWEDGLQSGFWGARKVLFEFGKDEPDLIQRSGGDTDS